MPAQIEYNKKRAPVPGKRRGDITTTETDERKKKSILLELIPVVGYRVFPGDRWAFLRLVCRQFADSFPAQQMYGMVPLFVRGFKRSKQHRAFVESLSQNRLSLTLDFNIKSAARPFFVCVVAVDWSQKS